MDAISGGKMYKFLPTANFSIMFFVQHNIEVFWKNVYKTRYINTLISTKYLSNNNTV